MLYQIYTTMIHEGMVLILCILLSEFLSTQAVFAPQNRLFSPSRIRGIKSSRILLANIETPKFRPNLKKSKALHSSDECQPRDSEVFTNPIARKFGIFPD